MATTREHNLIDAGVDYHAVAWGLALFACGGDIATTVYGVGIGLQESNPFIARLMAEFGILGLVAPTAVALSWVYVIDRRLGPNYGAAAAFGLALPKLAAIGLNLVAIFHA